jgi:HK97 family phage portal protein
MIKKIISTLSKIGQSSNSGIITNNETQLKVSSVIGIGQEFNYAIAAGALQGSQGLPQPKKQQTYENYVNLYGESSWVYACVFLVATSIAGVPLVLYKKKKGKDGKQEKIEDDNHEILKLFNRPNPFMSSFDMMEAIVAGLELTGNSYLEEVKKGRKIFELYPLQPHRMIIVPSKIYQIAGYRYTCQGKSVWFDEEEITHMKYHNPISDFYGASALTAAEISTQTDVRSSKWNKTFFENAARPDGVLETDQMLQDKTVNRLRTQWNKLYKGTSKAHQIAVLEGGLKYNQISISQKDMEFIDLRKMNRSEIFAVFGVHPALFGLVERINNSIMENIRRNFWENTLIPKMEKIILSLNRNLIEPYDETLILKFDVDSIESLKESRETRAKIAGMLGDRGIMTINEIRSQFFNLPEVSWGNTWYMPLNLTPVDRVGQGQVDKPLGRQPAPGKSIYPSSINDDGDIEFTDYSQHFDKLDSIEPLPKIIDMNDKEQIKARKKAFVDAHGKLENKFADVINKLSKKQADRVTKAAKKGKKLDALLKLVDKDKKVFRIAAEEFYENVIKIAGEATMKELKDIVESSKKDVKITFEFDVLDANILDFVDERSYDFWDDVSSTTKTKLRTVFNQALVDGKDTVQISDLLMDKVFRELTSKEGFTRALRISRTETTMALNQGTMQAYKQSNVKMKKSWLTAGDEDVRKTHEEAEKGGPIKIDDKFPNGLKHPGDPDGDVSELVNCRCSLLPEVKE